jgi:hypothetical protein
MIQRKERKHKGSQNPPSVADSGFGVFAVRKLRLGQKYGNFLFLFPVSPYPTNLTSHIKLCGTYVIKKRTIARTPHHGQMVLTILFGETPVAIAVVYSAEPTGGVSSPIARFKHRTMPI